MKRIVLKIVLFVLSVFYRLSVKIKHLFTKSKDLGIKVISIGNITLGGTGKTPTVITLAKWLKDKGKKVVVLSRGYGRQARGLVVVSNGEKNLVTLEEAGDEPYLLAEKLKGVPVIVGKDRYKSGIFVKEKFNSEIVILDDGFQYWHLKRDLDIVCLDSLTFLEKEPIFPLGILREPISVLKRANLLLLTNVNLITSEELGIWHQYLGRICPEVPIIESISQPVGLHLLSDDSSILEVSFLNGKEVVLLSSLGNPYAFEKTVEKLGAKVVKQYNYSDHHWYEQKDLFNPAKAGQGLIITTEKDEIKLKKFVSPELTSMLKQIYVLEIELQIVRGKDIWEEKTEQVCG